MQGENVEVLVGGMRINYFSSSNREDKYFLFGEPYRTLTCSGSLLIA